MTASCISRWMPLSHTEGNLQPLLSSPLYGVRTSLRFVALKPTSWSLLLIPIILQAIISQNQSCPFRPEGRERVSVLPQKSQPASCLGVYVSYTTPCLLHIVQFGLLPLQDHKDPAYLLFTLYSLPHTPP